MKYTEKPRVPRSKGKAAETFRCPATRCSLRGVACALRYCHVNGARHNPTFSEEACVNCPAGHRRAELLQDEMQEEVAKRGKRKRKYNPLALRKSAGAAIPTKARCATEGCERIPKHHNTGAKEARHYCSKCRQVARDRLGSRLKRVPTGMEVRKYLEGQEI